MAWMSDEQYLLMQDTRDKKITARSARHTKTHCGKSGAVKFPSDYMSKKEIKAMSGECKSYRLNEPMSWDEFKDMPDDLKITYVKALREKFNVPVTAFADMFGISSPVVSSYFKCLGLSKGRAAERVWNKEGFLAWRSGGSSEAVAPSETPIEEVADVGEKIDISKECGETYQTSLLVPEQGELTFRGNIDDILRTIKMVLDGKNVNLHVEWTVMSE